MFRKLLSASIVGAVAMASGVAFAQEPPKGADPQLPATPSMEQKGDTAKPAGADKSMDKAPMKKSMPKKSMMKKKSMKKPMHKSMKKPMMKKK